jgi:lactoylglutathione lyase/glyoxylase I family protein
VRVTRILHVSVNTHDTLVENQAFYAKLLGLDSKSRPEIPSVGGHWFAVGESELHLVDAPAGDGPIRPTGNHFCVAVDDIDAAIAELETEGIEYLRDSQGDVVQIWITDPAGNTIELQQDRGL